MDAVSTISYLQKVKDQKKELYTKVFVGVVWVWNIYTTQLSIYMYLIFFQVIIKKCRGNTRRLYLTRFKRNNNQYFHPDTAKLIKKWLSAKFPRNFIKILIRQIKFPRKIVFSILTNRQIKLPQNFLALKYVYILLQTHHVFVWCIYVIQTREKNVLYQYNILLFISYLFL